MNTLNKQTNKLTPFNTKTTMFINCLVDYLVDSAIQEAEFRDWERFTEPHPMALALAELHPDYNEYMGSRLGWKKNCGTSTSQPMFIEESPNLAYSPLKRKRDEEDEYEVTLKIRAPKHTKLCNVDVEIDNNKAWFSSGERYQMSPYCYTKTVLCSGKYCGGCLQNDC